MAPETKPKMSSALMAMKFMRQGEALKKEETAKQKQKQLEDSSRWTLRKAPKNSFLPIGSRTREKTDTRKKLQLETASFDDIYRQGSSAPEESAQTGRRTFGDFGKTAKEESEESVKKDLKDDDEDFDISDLTQKPARGSKKREGSETAEDQERYAKRRDFQALRHLKSISGGSPSAGSSDKKKKKKRYDRRGD